MDGRDWSSHPSPGSGRHLMITRAHVVAPTDSRRMQEIEFEGLRGERKRGVERVQNYGYTSVPLPPTGDRGAEAVVLHSGGSYSHPIVLGVDDRRHRPRNMEAGESAQYDDQGHRVQIRRSGIELIAPASKKVTIKVGDDTSIEVTKDKIKAVIGTNGPTFIMSRGKCVQMKKAGAPTLHFTVDLENSRLVQGVASVIAPDPFASE